MKPEVFKSFPGIEGYLFSNHGRVLSLARTVLRKHGRHLTIQEKIITPTIDWKDYFIVNISTSDLKRMTKRVHRIVGILFVPNPNKFKQLNHRDRNKLNNYEDNLEWCNNRENQSHKYHLSKKTSKYTGVRWDKKRKKWQADIQVNGKHVYLGHSDSEEFARDLYQSALVENGLTNRHALV